MFWTFYVFLSAIFGAPYACLGLDLSRLHHFRRPRPLSTLMHRCHGQVDIRVNEDAPSYPTTVDTDLVALGRLPLGGDDSSSANVPYDPRPASEGGCSAGHQEGCSIYNIKVSTLFDEGYCTVPYCRWVTFTTHLFSCSENLARVAGFPPLRCCDDHHHHRMHLFDSLPRETPGMCLCPFWSEVIGKDTTGGPFLELSLEVPRGFWRG